MDNRESETNLTDWNAVAERLMADRAVPDDFTAIRDFALHVAKLSGLRADAEDAAQDACIRVHDAMKRGKYDSGRSFVNWLWAVARHAAVDVARRRKRWRLEADRTEDSTDGLAGQVESGEPGPEEDMFLSRLFTAQPFAESDLNAIRSWPRRYRLVVLGVTGLFVRIPAAEWNEWLEREGWPSPNTVAESDNLKDRIHQWGEAIPGGAGTLPQIWLRQQVRLLELNCFWEVVRETVDELAADELAAVAGWPADQRIVLLSASSHWLRLPVWPCWDDWLREANWPPRVPLLVIVRKRRLSERLGRLRMHVRRRNSVDVFVLWRGGEQHLRGLARPPCPYLDDLESEATLP